MRMNYSRDKFLYYLIFLVIIPTLLNADLSDIEIKSEAAILMNADTGAILYEKNAYDVCFPASITKIATASYVIKVRGEKIDTMIAAEHDSIASISSEEKKRSNYSLPPHWLEFGATHMGIKRGEALSIKDLLYGTMLASANDASNILARFIGGTVGNFMSDLNEYCKELGCQNTHFSNPHGLHHPKHVTTAYDMALITKEALKDPLFREIVSTIRYPRPKTNKQEATTLIQRNRLIKKGQYYYSKAFGVKTGYTSAAKHTFVAAAKQNGRTLLLVLLKNPEKGGIFVDSKKLLQEAFKEKEQTKRLFRKGIQRVALSIPGASKKVKTYIRDDVKVSYYPSEKPQLKCQIAWENIELPIQQHQRVGCMTLANAEGIKMKVIPLYAVEEVTEGWIAWMQQLSIVWKVLIAATLFIITAFVLFVLSVR